MDVHSLLRSGTIQPRNIEEGPVPRAPEQIHLKKQKQLSVWTIGIPHDFGLSWSQVDLVMKIC